MVVLSFVDSVIGIAVTVLLAIVAVAAGAFTVRAGAVASVFGSAIVVTGGFGLFGLLVLFVVGSALATRYGFETKQRARVSEGTHGERGVANVLAHVIVPSALVVATVLLPGRMSVPYVEVLFAAALAFGASDTFASELGVLSGRARSILSLKPVTPGTNGGVSGAGEAWALLGAVSTSLFGLGLLVLFRYPVPDPVLLVGAASAAGFLGCQFDSVLGETLENRGLLSKHGTNLVAMTASVLFAVGIVAASGVRL